MMKIYVGNLPFSVDDNALKELFTSYGEVAEAVIIKDRFSNRSKGFGFVTLNDDEAAKKAIAEMHEKEIEGRKLTVNEAKPMEERPKRDFNRGGSGGNRDSRGPRRY
jgi:RNA recognition motif-containing protein